MSTEGEVGSNGITVSDPSEKMIPQSTVNTLLGETRRQVREKTTQEVMQALGQPKDPVEPKNVAPTLEELNRIVDARVNTKTAEQLQASKDEADRAMYERTFTHIGQKFKEKLERDPESADAINFYTEAIQTDRNPVVASIMLLAAANELDNLEDVLCHLATNDAQLSTISGLITGKMDKKASQSLVNLSKSLKSKGNTFKGAPAPLTKISASPTTPESKTVDSVQSFKSQLRF